MAFCCGLLNEPSHCRGQRLGVMLEKRESDCQDESVRRTAKSTLISKSV